jgi:hypothetical protein
LDLALTGAQINGSLGVQSVTRQQVESVLTNSLTYDDSETVTIPVGAITAALGYPIPLPDLTFRHMENSTASTEYKTVHTLEGTSGALLEFQIADSNPSRWIYTQVYYDTFFRTFVFRDSATPGRIRLADSLRERFQLDVRPVRRWESIRAEDHEDRYFVVGSLSALGIKKGTVEFIPKRKGKATHRVSVFPKTGNVMIPNMAEGVYTIRAGSRKYTFTLDKYGEVTIK